MNSTKDRADETDEDEGGDLYEDGGSSSQNLVLALTEEDIHQVGSSKEYQILTCVSTLL